MKINENSINVQYKGQNNIAYCYIYLQCKCHTETCWSTNCIGLYLLFYIRLTTFFEAKPSRGRFWEKKSSKFRRHFHYIISIGFPLFIDGWLLPLHLWSNRLWQIFEDNIDCLHAWQVTMSPNKNHVWKFLEVYVNLYF